MSDKPKDWKKETGYTKDQFWKHIDSIIARGRKNEAIMCACFFELIINGKIQSYRNASF